MKRFSSVESFFNFFNPISGDSSMTNEEKIEELKAFCAVGNYFIYLGVSFNVVKHKDISYNYETRDTVEVPELTTRYVDRNGEVHTETFNHDELQALKIATD